MVHLGIRGGRRRAIEATVPGDGYLVSGRTERSDIIALEFRWATVREDLIFPCYCGAGVGAVLYVKLSV